MHIPTTVLLSYIVIIQIQYISTLHICYPIYVLSCIFVILHSSNVVGVELCQLARARRLCLYHHEPIFGDERLATLLAETRRLEEITRDDHRVEVFAAYDGMEIAL